MRQDNFETLYNCIYNAEFWKGCGFKNKRSSSEVEKKERTYLENHIESIAYDIDDKRESVSIYMKRVYRNDIKLLNIKDMRETYPIITQVRMDKKIQQARENAKNEFSREQIGWIEEIDTKPSMIVDIVKEELYDRLKSVSSASIEDIQPSQDYNIISSHDIERISEEDVPIVANPSNVEYRSDTCSMIFLQDNISGISDEYNPIDTIKKICLKYPNESCSIEILNYLKNKNL